MPHSRPRLALSFLLKRLKFTPVVAIQGARQTGKSYLARELLEKELPDSVYITLDDQTKQSLAQTNPQTILASLEKARPIIIDEAQKSPALFDAIKLIVDKDRHPGSFLLLGSTEFSVLQNIRESLTGRMGKVRFYPMVFKELYANKSKGKITRAECLKFLDSGGMPGIAFVRDSNARSEFFQDWIDLTCERDIHQFKRLKLDSGLAYELIRKSATLEEATLANLSKATRANPKKVATHVKALCELFVLNRLDPHSSGTGKSIYLPLDAGIAGHLGASTIRRLQILLLNERMAANSYAGDKRNIFRYYRSSGKRIIHLVEEELDGKLRAFQIFDQEQIKKTDLELIKAFKKKNPKSQILFLAPILDRIKFDGVQLCPWEWMFESS